MSTAWQGRNPPPDQVNDGFPGWYGNEKQSEPGKPSPYAALPVNASVQDFRNTIGLLQTKLKELDSQLQTFVDQTERMSRFETSFNMFMQKYELEMTSLQEMIMRELGPSEEQPETQEETTNGSN